MDLGFDPSKAKSLLAKPGLLAELDRLDSQDSLTAFVKRAWKTLEPESQYVYEWPIEAIAEHLEAVTNGQITRLLINVPPGLMKSLMTSVFWPSWEWGPKNRPSLRYLATSFNENPVKRDSRKMRDLVASNWYKERWPHVQLTRGGEISFSNTSTGSREGVPFGSLTSQRGDRLIIDDPHSTDTAESPAERQKTTRRFREGASNRLNNQEKSAIIVIMQRLHEQDISGVIVDMGLPYVHLRLPMEYESTPQKINGKTFDPKVKNEIGFVDPRTEEGELLSPVRFPPNAIKELYKVHTAFSYAGQYQQRPTAREGSMFKREWFLDKFLDKAPPGTRWVRHWDLAATAASNSARTAGVKMGVTPTGEYIVGHVIKERKEGHEVRKTIKMQAIFDGHDVQISLPQDPGQAGKVQAKDYIKLLAGFIVRASPERGGDKEQRAEPFSAQCEGGNVYLIKGSWNEDYIDELCGFPGMALKDQVDASSGAFSTLLLKRNLPTAQSGKMSVR